MLIIYIPFVLDYWRNKDYRLYNLIFEQCLSNSKVEECQIPAVELKNGLKQLALCYGNNRHTHTFI